MIVKRKHTGKTPIKIISRDFRAALGKFDVTKAAKDYSPYPGAYTVTALGKEELAEARRLTQASDAESDLTKQSSVSPVVYSRKPALGAWNRILSLYRTPEAIVLFQNRVYEVLEEFPEEELRLTILEMADRERKKFEHLKAKFDTQFRRLLKDPRTRIPEDVRIFVWRRDEGKCAKCGSRINLTYDHIIPVSKGGGNTARNIELLCEECNFKKGDRLG